MRIVKYIILLIIIGFVYVRQNEMLWNYLYRNRVEVLVLGDGLVKIYDTVYRLDPNDIRYLDKYPWVGDFKKKLYKYEKMFNSAGPFYRFSFNENTKGQDLIDVYYHILERFALYFVEISGVDISSISFDNIPCQYKSPNFNAPKKLGEYIPLYVQTNGVFYLTHEGDIKVFDESVSFKKMPLIRLFDGTYVLTSTLPDEQFENRYRMVELDCVEDMNIKEILEVVNKAINQGANSINIVIVDKTFTLEEFKKIHMQTEEEYYGFPDFK